MKVVVFDLGGTLMQYVGMPYSWEDFYHKGFEEIIRKYDAYRNGCPVFCFTQKDYKTLSA